LKTEKVDVPESQWHIPPEQLTLGDGEVHVWRARLEQSISTIQRLEQTLAGDEQARAEQFRFQQDRLRFIVARGILRTILGQYLGRDPGTLQFRYSQYGKPALAEDIGSDSNSLLFNVAHSRGMALYAVTRKGISSIGIDIEYLDTSVPCEQIAERFFSPFEVRMLQAVSEEMRHVAFFSCWTRKEAYVKARGMGLSLDLKQFDVSVTPGEPVAILSSREESQNTSNWFLYDLFPDPGYMASLAVEGHPANITCWQWSK
jgi:4'-phosphopantetheinyl transferase